MQDAGADLIEIGIPFSDPIAEGQEIEAANTRALSNGTTTDKIFKMINEIKDEIIIPLCFLTYINPIYTYGIEKFMSNSKQCGISGLIIPDLPFEEKDEIFEVCNKYEINLISIIAPTSKQRIEKIAKEAQGFVYCISSLGVTGIRNAIRQTLKKMVDQIKISVIFPAP
jgi:tryptophan synthase alpha chain